MSILPKRDVQDHLAETLGVTAPVRAPIRGSL